MEEDKGVTCSLVDWYVRFPSSVSAKNLSRVAARGPEAWGAEGELIMPDQGSFSALPPNVLVRGWSWLELTIVNIRTNAFKGFKFVDVHEPQPHHEQETRHGLIHVVVRVVQ